jgi:hypothetical protein
MTKAEGGVREGEGAVKKNTALTFAAWLGTTALPP